MPPATITSPCAVVERLPVLDGVPLVDVADAFRDLANLALLESARPGRTGRWSFLVADPLAIIEGSAPGPDPFAGARAALARLAAEVPTALERGPGGGDATSEGADLPSFTGGLVGYLAYDIGRRLERLPDAATDDQGLPDLRLGLHDWVIARDARTGHAWLGGRAAGGDGAVLARRHADVRLRAAAVGGAFRERSRASSGAQPALVTAAPGGRLRFTSIPDRAGWRRAIERLRAAIAAGELYQANLARRLAAPFSGDPWPLFRALRAGEPSAFAAYLDLGRGTVAAAPGGSAAGPPAIGASGRGLGGPRAILSASPEPFLRLDAGGFVRTDPIKGTRPRGIEREADRRLAAELLSSTKDRAENTMIVDVLRNDLGRVCVPGSVRVPRLCRLERTVSVQHLVSTVTGRLAPGRDAFDLLRAAMPGGSITGAPKIRAMELIETLEPVRRGPYCGAAAWFDGGGAMGSSILIRTLVADGSRLTFHVGGGITWRSDADAEWEETRTKAGGPLRALGITVEGDEEA